MPKEATTKRGKTGKVEKRKGKKGKSPHHLVLHTLAGLKGVYDAPRRLVLYGIGYLVLTIPDKPHPFIANI